MTQEPYGTIPMFEVPEMYRAPEAAPKAVVWAAWKGARISCGDCVRNIAKGLNRHFSEPATKVRTSADGKAYYCYRHGFEAQVQDELAGLWRRK